MESWLENAGTLKGSFPQTIIPVPLRKIEAPTVMITRTMGWGFLAVRMANRSNSSPKLHPRARVQTMATGRGRAICTQKVTMAMAPTMTNSPWAKLMSSVELYNMDKPTAITA